MSEKKKLLPRSAFAGVRFEHLAAGVSGGVTSTLLLHPLDLMKIRFAVCDVVSSTSSTATTPVSRPHYNGLTSAMTQVFRDEGIRGLYRGVTPNVWGAGSAWGLYFLFYQGFKSYLQNGDTKVNLGPGVHMLVAAEAGLCTLVLTNPIWVVKTRLCLQMGPSHSAVSDPRRYKGMFDALFKTYKYEGIRGLYKGFVPGAFGVSHGALQFMAYEELKTRYNQYRYMPIDAKLTTIEYLTFAAVSKLFAAVTTYPYQVLRARMQDQHSQYTTVRHCIKDTFRKNGFSGYYYGLRPYCVRVIPATAITFVAYEKVSSFLVGRTDSKKPELDVSAAKSDDTIK